MDDSRRSVEGHKFPGQEVAPLSDATMPFLARATKDSLGEVQTQNVALEEGSSGQLISTASATSAPAGGRIGYCWPGHPEVENDWKIDGLLNLHDVVFKDSQIILSTLNDRKVWTGHGDGKGYAWHKASAGGQLGTKAVLAYGAIASCLGSTKWWVSYRTSSEWKTVLDGWECEAGRTGVWRVTAKAEQKKVLGIPIPGKYKYKRFDMRFHAESEPGAFHRYYVSFWTMPDS